MPRAIRRFQDSQEDTENPFALSLGDLMSSLLMIFILMLTSVLLRLNNEIAKQTKYESVKRQIIFDLQQELETYEVTDAGEIKLEGDILFPFGRGVMSNEEEAKELIRILVPQFSEILFRTPERRKYVDKVMIEGHTDPFGGYLSNLGLSLDRAGNVARFVRVDKKLRDFPHRSVFFQKLTVNGRSSAELIYTEDEKVSSEQDPSKEEKEKNAINRRVIFKFRLIDKDWETELKNQARKIDGFETIIDEQQ